MIDGITYRQWLVGMLAAKLNVSSATLDPDSGIENYLIFVDKVIDAEAETAAPEDDSLFPDLSRFGLDFTPPSPEGLRDTIAAMQAQWAKTLYPKE